MPKRLLMGNEAFAHAALEAGVGFVAGYPGTPSSELIETVAACVAKGQTEGVHVEWSTNEKAALELCAAASMSGTRALFTCKQVGLNVASDALMSLNYVGIRGGLVLFVADDPGPISSQTEQDTRRFGAFAKLPVLDPSTPEQGFEMMQAAFDLSEKYGTPVIVRPTTRINHASTFFDVAEKTQARAYLPLPEIPSFAEGADDAEGFVREPARWVIFPRRAFEAHGQINDRLSAIASDFANDDVLARFNTFYADGKKAELAADAVDDGVAPALGIVAGGCSARYALEALSALKEGAKKSGAQLPHYKLLQVGTPYPAPTETLEAFLAGVADVIVFEELDYVLEDELLKIAGRNGLLVSVHGKLTGETSTRGENTTEAITMQIAEFFDKYAKGEGASEGEEAKKDETTFAAMADAAFGKENLFSFDGVLPARPPVLCAGCPHRSSFYAAKKALDKLGVKRTDAIFCGDIGCYTLGNAAPLDAVDTCLCMGAGITMSQGFSATNAGKKALAFIGDSTFFASGMTGVANAVYNNHDITVFVLDNSTTAMTGAQPHPGTGRTLMGTQSKPLDIETVLTALGVQNIQRVNALDLEAAVEASASAIAYEGPAAVILKSPCIWLFKNENAALVNVDTCIGCKKCITEIGCPAISFNPQASGAKSGKRGQAVIDTSLCNGCGLCTQVCPCGSINVYERSQLAAAMKQGGKDE